MLQTVNLKFVQNFFWNIGSAKMQKNGGENKVNKKQKNILIKGTEILAAGVGCYASYKIGALKAVKNLTPSQRGKLLRACGDGAKIIMKKGY